MKKLLVICFLFFNTALFFNGLTTADNFTISGDTKADSGKLVRLSVTNAPEKSGIIWDISPEDKADIQELPGGKLILTGLPGTYFIKVRAVQVGADGQVTVVTARVTVVIGQPDPVPPGPGPPNPGPIGPVTSFHVFLVHDSKATYTKEQEATLHSTKVADYLDTNAVPGGSKAWRRFTKDTVTTNDDPTINALWTAVKSKLTTTPCVIIEVNTKAEILPLPESPDALIELLKKYRGQ